MKTQTFAAAQWAYDNALPPEDNLLAQHLEALTLDQLLNYGKLEGSYGRASDFSEYKAELASRPAPENVELLYDTEYDLRIYAAGLGMVYVYDSNLQTEHTIAEYPWWLQHIIPGWTLSTSFRCAESVQHTYQTHLLTGDF